MDKTYSKQKSKNKNNNKQELRKSKLYEYVNFFVSIDVIYESKMKYNQ